MHFLAKRCFLLARCSFPHSPRLPTGLPPVYTASPGNEVLKDCSSFETAHCYWIVYRRNRLPLIFPFSNFRACNLSHLMFNVQWGSTSGSWPKRKLFLNQYRTSLNFLYWYNIWTRMTSISHRYALDGNMFTPRDFPFVSVCKLILHSLRASSALLKVSSFEMYHWTETRGNYPWFVFFSNTAPQVELWFQSSILQCTRIHNFCPLKKELGTSEDLRSNEPHPCLIMTTVSLSTAKQPGSGSTASERLNLRNLALLFTLLVGVGFINLSWYSKWIIPLFRLILMREVLWNVSLYKVLRMRHDAQQAIVLPSLTLVQWCPYILWKSFQLICFVITCDFMQLENFRPHY